MARQSLLEYFHPGFRPANEVAVVWKRGYRTVRWSTADLLKAAHSVARELSSRGLAKGERVLIWGENSGEWIAAFLGCMFCGAVAVPMDAIADPAFAERVVQQADVHVAIVSRELQALKSVRTNLWLEEIAKGDGESAAAGFTFAPAARDDLLEVVFTSGTTAEPRGVPLTHGNLLANLETLEREIAHYRRYERIFHPLRFLELLPLSHVFGQLLGIFLPQILGATTIFLDTFNPSDVIRTIHDERVSLLVTVPRVIESLRDQVERDLEAAGRLENFRTNFDRARGEHFLKRWWRFRSIRRRFGWKFWAMVSGGAALPPQAEEFWGRLGYAVIQGYGLTETASLVSVNHPFRLGRGSIGKTLPGTEVKLSDNGEILVRGANVASGYWHKEGAATVLDEEGWFHTGDLGERDTEGRLYFKGRSKNVIVTAEGLNVYPEDLEGELRKEPDVRDCVVVGLERDGNAEPCAVLLLRDAPTNGDAQASEIVRRANQRLAPFQQMRRWFVWPDKDFPRTATQKPALASICETVSAELATAGAVPGHGTAARTPLGELVSRISRGRVMPGEKSETLGLTSIERVELLSALEDRYQIDLSENEFARAETVESIEKLLTRPQESAPQFHYPRWAQSWPVRILRAAVFYVLARPAMLLLGWPRVKGRENVSGVNGPVVVVSNHVAFFDATYVREALPAGLRNRLAVAMDGELLESMRNPPPDTGFFRGLAERASYWLVVALFNVFPLPMHAGFRKSFSFAGALVDRGWNVLIFPEGAITKTGRLGPFRSGIGLLASQLRVPIVPVYIDGIFERKQAGEHWAPPGQIKVSIGAPENFSESEPAEQIAGRLERRVRELGGGELQ